MIDLVGTIVMPATILYLIWILYLGLTEGSQFVQISLILLAAVYGLQAIIFLLRRKWEHVMWMIIYLLALPVFGFYIPLYSFWHFDDFSWGNTRLVVGEKGQRKFVADEEEKFDPKAIPRKKWGEHEQELWEAGTTVSYETSQSGGRSKTAPLQSVYGSEYGSAPRARSPVPPLQPSRPVTAYSQHAGGSTMEPGRSPRFDTSPNASPGLRPVTLAMPADDEILAQVRKILDTADLMTVTKKQVRDELSRVFGIDMSPRKEWINMCIEGILAGKL